MPSFFNEERENVAAGVAHEAVEHSLAGNDGKVAVRATVKGHGARKSDPVR